MALLASYNPQSKNISGDIANLKTLMQKIKELNNAVEESINKKEVLALIKMENDC